MLLRHAPWAARALRRTGVIGDHHLTPWDPHIVRQDLTKRLPFDDGSVDAVYSSHFFEHIYYSDAGAILKECHRVLRPGGVLRLAALPDGEAWARELIESEDDAGEAGHRYLLRLGSHPLERPTGKPGADGQDRRAHPSLAADPGPGAQDAGRGRLRRQ